MLRPALTTLSTLAVISVYVQLILGAAFRHNGMKLVPHLLSAMVVTTLLIWTCARVLKRHSDIAQLRKPALFLLGMVMLQLALGMVAYLSRVIWGKDAPQPEMVMVVSTVAHVAVGALVLATTVVLAVQARRHIAIVNEQTLTSTQKAVIA